MLHAARATPDAVGTILRTHRTTIFCGVPTLFGALLVHPDFPARDELALRLCTSAGEPLPEEIGKNWTARFGVEIIDGIGSTEMLHIFISNRPGAVRYGTTGLPVPGYRARIVGEDGRDVAPGELGELEVSGPTSAAYYWNNREKSRATFAGEWTRTGDKYRQDEDGHFVYCGRVDDMLKVGGIWVSPSEVESALVAHDHVLEAAVIGVEDEQRPRQTESVRRAQARRATAAGARRRAEGAREEPAGAVQIPALDRVRRRAAEDRHRQDSPARPARARTTLTDEVLAQQPLARDVVVDGKRLETVRYAGDPARPAIVMLHEGLGSISLWRDLPQRLRERTRCTVVAYSRYGYGRSDVLREPREPDYMHYEGEVVVPALLAQLHIERPILFGHSDGASIALIHAGAHPGAVRALVLEAPHVFVEDISVRSIAEAKTAYATTDLPAKLGRHHADAGATFAGWNDIWLDPRFRDWNIEAYAERVRVPVLLIQGEADEYGTTAQLDAIAARIPGTQTLMVPHAAHSPHRDAPNAVLDAVAAFVDTV